MAIPQIVPYDYFYQWREKTNLLANLVGDITLINVSANDRDSFVEAINKVISNLGSLPLLTTTDKTSTVNSINELDGEIGVLSSLTTTAKNTIVASINEHQGKIGTATLTTTAQTILAAVNELDTEHGTLSSLTTTHKTSFVGAINELDTDVGSLTGLLTTDKDSVVDAINELFGMHLITNVTFTIGTETSDVIRVSAQLKNSAGNDIAFRANVFAYLSDNSDGSTLLASEHSGGWAIGTDGLLIPQTANKSARFTTNNTGAFNVDITETATKTAYLVVVLPNGKNIVSSAITHAA